jgi:hypothetical protein
MKKKNPERLSEETEVIDNNHVEIIEMKNTTEIQLK